MLCAAGSKPPRQTSRLPELCCTGKMEETAGARRKMFDSSIAKLLKDPWCVDLHKSELSRKNTFLSKFEGLSSRHPSSGSIFRSMTEIISRTKRFFLLGVAPFVKKPPSPFAK